MKFEWPIALLALALVPLLVGLLWLSRRRDSRYAIRFSNVSVLAEVAQATRSPWRFVPPVLLLTALAALAVGLARPSVSVSADRKQGTIVLALDRSGSMLAQDIPPDRITASRDAAGGFVSFSDTANALSAPSFDHSVSQKAIASIQAGGGTAIGDAIVSSLGLLGVNSAVKPTAAARKGRAILLLSDGSNTEGTDISTAADAAKRAGVPVYTIAFGTPSGVLDLQAIGQGTGTIPVPPDPEALKAIAQRTGGESFTALDESTLKKVYDHIGTRVSSTKEQKELTFVVAGLAAVLLAAAAASSWLLRIT